MKRKFKIYTIIVCFNPDINSLISLCETLLHSNSEVVVIDNTDVSYIAEAMNSLGCVFIAMNVNSGIAHAQNTGISHALGCGAEIIVFFDQDTKIDGLFLGCLLDVIRDDTPLVVSPVYYDDAKGYEFPALKLNKYGIPTKKFSKGSLKPYEVDIIISSGSAATAATFKKVGLMDEDFFIDYVDIEWCIRCRNKNIPIMVVPTATMKHSIGESSVNLGVMRGHIHSPLRSYYKLRNCFLLFRKSDIPFLFAINEILTSFIHSTIMMFYVKDKLKYLFSYFYAIYDGVQGIVGKRTLR